MAPLGGLLKAADNDAAPAVAANDAGVSSNDSYVIQPLDLLHVQVFQEDDLTRDVRVSQSNTIALPLIGVVDLQGLTVKQAADKIGALYNASYLVNPQISITVTEYAQRVVNVLGAVGQPGAIPFPQEQGLFLLDAIARAGGFTRLADRSHVKLTRRNTKGDAEVDVIDADSIMKSGNANPWPLKPNDVIYVPERIF